MSVLIEVVLAVIKVRLSYISLKQLSNPACGQPDLAGFGSTRGAVLN